MSKRGNILRLERTEIDAPIGTIIVVLHAGRLCALGFEDRWSGLASFLERRFGRIEFCRSGSADEIKRKIEAYFEGEVAVLSSVEVDSGGTAFQQRVWSELRKIPAGETRSYGELAKAIGSPDAVRAVGAANGANPVSIVVPCHRVIGANGKLVGYGGGMERKRWLLEHEARAAQTNNGGSRQLSFV